MENFINIFTPSIVFGLALSAIVQVVKVYIKPKFGDWGVRLFLLLLATAIALIKFGLQYVPIEYLVTIGTIIASSTGIYVFFSKTIEN